MNFKIAIELWDGVEELDFAGPYEVLTAWARDSERPITVRTVAVEHRAGYAVHTGFASFRTSSYDDVGDSTCSCFRAGTRAARRRRGVPPAAPRPRGERDVDDECLHRCPRVREGGPARRPSRDDALERARAARRLRQRCRRAMRAFVDDGNVVTAAGVSAGIDMALHLVARLDSVRRAANVRRYIQYD